MDNYLILKIIIIGLVLLQIAYLIKLFLKQGDSKKVKGLTLSRAECNPIMSPDPGSYWESEGTFNPGAILDDEGNVHLFYRAIGSDGKSRLGYAQSSDGINFTDKSPYPVYESDPVNRFPKPDPEIKTFSPSFYTSGGGWSGCEDPRAVVIGERIYITYVAFGGWDSIRIAVTSISVQDFKNKKWNWKRSRLISPSGEINKNWVLFPEKINGKFAFLHSLYPKILIDFTDDIDSLEYTQKIKSQSPKGGFVNSWDNAIRGAGPPPLKTKDGWLLIYHAMDKNDPNKYKLGAMLLDLKDPTKLLKKAPLPILSPDMHYENDYKPGVVYASGAVIKDKMLYVYYGGGDKHVCVAKTKVNDLLKWLDTNSK